jgi:hypothetical protein
MGDGGADVVIIVKDGQPGTHPVRLLPDERGIDPVLPEAEEDILPGTGIIREGDKLRSQAQIAEVLGDIPADAAMDVAHFAGVAAAGDIGGMGVAFDVYEDGAYDSYAHNDYLSLRGLSDLPGLPPVLC